MEATDHGPPSTTLTLAVVTWTRHVRWKNSPAASVLAGIRRTMDGSTLDAGRLKI